MQIHILDSETVDKIAAGEVVERPASVVKELVENAIDAGATAITVEAKEGGIEFIRVTDNGSGIAKEQLRTAFLRHATSKIKNADELTRVSSLGFRGEALSSIAAVARVEVITKTADTLTGVRYLIEGAAEMGFDEIGAPEGTTFLVRNLFFNTPVRRKFLKQPPTEGGYIADLMEHLALSRPDISFKLVLGNQTRFHTSGNGDLKEVIYRIYGREVAASLVPVQFEEDGIRVEGYLGKPTIVRSNRNFEIYFINGRFVRSNVVSKAIEEGYKEYLMQHKFPMCVLHITMDAERVDVNVHPTKMDVRFSDNMAFVNQLIKAVRQTLKNREMIPNATLRDEREQKAAERANLQIARKQKTPEPFEWKREQVYRVEEETKYQASMENADESVRVMPQKTDFLQNPVWNRVKPVSAQAKSTNSATEAANAEEEAFFVEVPQDAPLEAQEEKLVSEPVLNVVSEVKQEQAPEQINLFQEKILTVENRMKYRIIGQVFETYWMLQYEDKMMIIDQHAAHEKVKYERLMAQYRAKTVASQGLMPPVIVSLTGQEESVLSEHGDVFAELGFEIEAFGGSEYALRSVPVDLYGCEAREMFLEVLDELCEGKNFGSLKVVEEKIASMACKAAVKGNNRMSVAEAEKLIDELLTLENPYNCPHGRPTIITMSKYEMEKKFKRIL